MRKKTALFFKNIQNLICTALEEIDGKKLFEADPWNRRDLQGDYGGGGTSRTISKGGIFEKGGVNFSEVYGHLSSAMSKKLIGQDAPAEFFATGISLVLHPDSPMIPTTHANYRYLEVEQNAWFGGGMDLTPYYLFEEDAVHFHKTIKAVCDKHDLSYYPRFKKWCDEYFYLPHRKESRGVGGIFFDYLGKNQANNLESIYSFVKDCALTFVPCYVPIVKARKETQWDEKEKSFQIFRRGRYVEFNLLYDRGTQFGLKTGGRTESILMSLPPQATWEYNRKIPDKSREAALISVFKNPREWAAEQ